MFYAFRQNNSGGSFVKNTDVDVLVVIEADDRVDATDKALEIGIYFDGCNQGADCPCCGDRWWPTDDDDAKPFPHYYGTKLEARPNKLKGDNTIIHYKDGTRGYALS